MNGVHENHGNLFTTDFIIRFTHVDAAGIVYYPRYLEMINEAVERWFEEGLALPYHELIFVHRLGVPTRRVNIEFFKPSRLGDKVTFALRVTKMGRSSFDLLINCLSGDETRFTAAITLVFASLEPLASVPIPDALRDRIAAFAKTTG